MRQYSSLLLFLSVITGFFCVSIISCRTVEDDDTNAIINTHITDTIYVDSVVHDTSYIDSVVHDTAYIDSIIQDTIFVDSIIHDTIIVDSVIHDTIVVEREVYHNPIIGINAPDPSVIKAENGYFYLYATSRNVSIFKSQNLTDWIHVGSAFEEDKRPTIVSGAAIWAPDINYIDGRYVMYYSQSTWGGRWNNGIGIAVSETPQGPFTDLGPLITTKGIGVLNSIDPYYIEDNGQKYLFWGSLNGIYGIKLSEDGLSVMTGAQKFQVAADDIEGSYIHKHGNYYYLFASHGRCCDGSQSTYKVVCGRSDNIEGPYVSKSGYSMLSGQYETLLKGNNYVAGPGHNAEFITDDGGNDWIIYHGYLRSDPEAGRLVFLDQIHWKDGWPSVDKNSPSNHYYSPVILY